MPTSLMQFFRLTAKEERQKRKKPNNKLKTMNSSSVATRACVYTLQTHRDTEWLALALTHSLHVCNGTMHRRRRGIHFNTSACHCIHPLLFLLVISCAVVFDSVCASLLAYFTLCHYHSLCTSRFQLSFAFRFFILYFQFLIDGLVAPVSNNASILFFFLHLLGTNTHVLSSNPAKAIFERKLFRTFFPSCVLSLSWSTCCDARCA